jgi:uncharacterized protein YecT (DUF1311 family)
MRERLVLLGVLLLLVRVGSGQQEQSALCRRVAAVPVPAVAAIHPQACEKVDLLELKAWNGHPVDLALVRRCALAARADNQGEADWMEPVAGNASLAMIYAGGFGVTPNLKLAERFACEIQDWDGTGAFIADFLEAKRLAGATRVVYDACSKVTGRGLNFQCLLRDQQRVAYETETVGDRLNAGQPGTVSAAWRSLLKARRGFRDAHGAEMPTGTTGIVQGDMRDDIDADTAWLARLRSLAAGQMPAAGDLGKADAALNVAYRKVLREVVVDDGQVLSLSSKAERECERAWLRYRDAWAKYATLRWPGVRPEVWRAGLTEERSEELATLAEQGR